MLAALCVLLLLVQLLHQFEVLIPQPRCLLKAHVCQRRFHGHHQAQGLAVKLHVSEARLEFVGILKALLLHGQVHLQLQHDAWVLKMCQRLSHAALDIVLGAGIQDGGSKVGQHLLGLNGSQGHLLADIHGGPCADCKIDGIRWAGIHVHFISLGLALGIHARHKHTSIVSVLDDVSDDDARDGEAECADDVLCHIVRQRPDPRALHDLHLQCTALLLAYVHREHQGGGALKGQEHDGVPTAAALLDRLNKHPHIRCLPALGRGRGGCPDHATPPSAGCARPQRAGQPKPLLSLFVDEGRGSGEASDTAKIARASFNDA
mmetsp:Transcript_22233/g.61469  ORF Transcript_22233/g.61469 Transcript_22233/m.61469 type:complete len:319 (-) Transcript_22233:120-1076(-)